MDLSNYVYAGFPYLFIETMEIKRALKAIETEEEVTKYYWNIINGFAHLEGENANPADALEFAAKDANSKSIILAENFDQFLDDITLSQQMMNIGILLKNKQVVFAIVGTDPSLIPSCLEKLVTVIDFPLPTKYEFRKIVQDLVEQVDIPYNQSIADSCVGLSLEEGENAVAYSICQDSELNMDSILKAKTAMIKKSGFMEIIHPEPIENIGGLIKIKEYVKKRLPAYEEGSTLSKLKGLFLVGIPGCGKSLFAKVLGSILKCPVIKMDIGAMKGGIVGETEKKTRMATKIIDSQGLCVVLLDEVEKLFAGATGTVTDSSGTSQGQMGHLLTWTQERSSEAILIATSNNISALPPEFTRAGRWDSIWFFGFPNHDERKEIVSIMNTKYNTNIPETDKFVEKLENWTGAEIEQLAKDSQFEELDYCMENIPIISKYKKNELKHLLEFASSVRKANSDDSIVSTKRKVSLKTIETPEDLELDSLKEKIKKKHLT